MPKLKIVIRKYQEIVITQQKMSHSHTTKDQGIMSSSFLLSPSRYAFSLSLWYFFFPSMFLNLFSLNYKCIQHNPSLSFSSNNKKNLIKYTNITAFNYLKNVYKVILLLLNKFLFVVGNLSKHLFSKVVYKIFKLKIIIQFNKKI